MKTGFNGSGVAAFDGVEDYGETMARRRWCLTPAAVVAMAGMGGSSVSVGVGVDRCQRDDIPANL